MGKWLLVAALVAVSFFFIASSRSDVAPTVPTLPPPTPGLGMAEPITGTAVQPAPGSESQLKDPFKPYDIGPSALDKSPKPTWSRSDLTAAERAVADKGTDVTGWDTIHNAFGQAAAERAHEAAASSAASQLGVDNLGTTGVVP